MCLSLKLLHNLMCNKLQRQGGGTFSHIQPSSDLWSHQLWYSTENRKYASVLPCFSPFCTLWLNHHLRRHQLSNQKCICLQIPNCRKYLISQALNFFHFSIHIYICPVRFILISHQRVLNNVWVGGELYCITTFTRKWLFPIMKSFSSN